MVKVEPWLRPYKFQEIMVYECRIFNGKGKLKKIMGSKEIQALSDKRLFSQKSTQKAQKNISNFKDVKKEQKQIVFHNNQCVFCGKMFHPRHQSTKYCSHECQRSYYLERKKRDC